MAEFANKYQMKELTVYTLRHPFGGIDKSEVAVLKRLVQENARLKKLLAERVMEIEVMQEVNSKIDLSVSNRETATPDAKSRGIPQHLAYWQVARLAQFQATHSARSCVAGLSPMRSKIDEIRPSWDCEMVREILSNRGIATSGNLMQLVLKTGNQQSRADARPAATSVEQPAESLQTSPNSVWLSEFAEDRAHGRKMFLVLSKDLAAGLCQTSKTG